MEIVYWNGEQLSLEVDLGCSASPFVSSGGRVARIAMIDLTNATGSMKYAQEY